MQSPFGKWNGTVRTQIEIDMTYIAKDKTFVTELSDHDLKSAPPAITLKNPKTGNPK